MADAAVSRVIIALQQRMNQFCDRWQFTNARVRETGVYDDKTREVARAIARWIEAVNRGGYELGEAGEEWKELLEHLDALQALANLTGGADRNSDT